MQAGTSIAAKKFYHIGITNNGLLVKHKLRRPPGMRPRLCLNVCFLVTQLILSASGSGSFGRAPDCLTEQQSTSCYIIMFYLSFSLPCAGQFILKLKLLVMPLNFLVLYRMSHCRWLSESAGSHKEAHLNKGDASSQKASSICFSSKAHYSCCRSDKPFSLHH